MLSQGEKQIYEVQIKNSFPEAVVYLVQKVLMVLLTSRTKQEITPDRSPLAEVCGNSVHAKSRPWRINQ